MHTPIENIFVKLQSKQEKNFIITAPFPRAPGKGETTFGDQFKPGVEKRESFLRKRGDEKVTKDANLLHRLKKRENFFSKVNVFGKHVAPLPDSHLSKNELPKKTKKFSESNATSQSISSSTIGGIGATQSTSKGRVFPQGKKRKKISVKSAYTVNSSGKKKRIIISRGKITPRKFRPSPRKNGAPLAANPPYTKKSTKHTPITFLGGKGNVKQRQSRVRHPSSLNFVDRAPELQAWHGKEQKTQLSPPMSQQRKSGIPIKDIRFAENTFPSLRTRAPFSFPPTAPGKNSIENEKHQQKGVGENSSSTMLRGFPKVRVQNPVDFISATIHIQSTHNNTIYTLTDNRARTRGWISAGTCGFKNTRKATSYASQAAAEKCASLAKAINCTSLSLKIRGLGPGKLSGVRTIHQSGLRVSRIWECTTLPHNGCRRKRSRRI